MTSAETEETSMASMWDVTLGSPVAYKGQMTLYSSCTNCTHLIRSLFGGMIGQHHGLGGPSEGRHSRMRAEDLFR